MYDYATLLIRKAPNRMLMLMLMGHSCNIGNAPNFVGKKLKTLFGELWIYI